MGELSFGEWLKRQRKAAGLTQAQLAHQVSCSTITLRKIEAEERRPSEQMAARLADIFHVPQDERTAFLGFARSGWGSAPVHRIADAPWRDLAAGSRSNLPTPTTSFIGREKEVEEIVRLVGKNRLVTLTGPGGVGKTRLAIQSSNRVASQFSDGVCWVELAALTDETLVPQALATSLEVREIPNQSLNEALFNFLHSKQILLVLDNCEHLIVACAQLADWLLGSCPRLTILGTSREALGVAGEQVWSVPILSLPDVQRISLADLLMQYEGIRLFVERACAVDAGFRLTEQNALSVAQVCQRLDGMPLAIELAAARVKMMSVGEIAKRLNDRFNLLTAGNRAALPRHQTLRAAMDWSYDLLSESERIFFCRLSIFAGGFTLDAAEMVAAGGDVTKAQITDLLGQLISKSLVTVGTRSENPESETRYGMLETIREYAREKLEESGKAEQVHQRHCDFFLAFAEQAEPKLKSAQQIEWLNRLELEHDNLRVALHWANEVKEAEANLRLAGALAWFWNRRSYLSEGRGWIERALAVVDATAITSARAKALYGAAYLARSQGDFASAYLLVGQSIDLWRKLDSKPELSQALTVLGELVRNEGDPATARSIIEEGIAIAREQRDGWCLAWSLLGLGMAIRDQDNYDLALSLLEESVALWHEQGDLWGLAEALHFLALVDYRRGNYAAAYSIMEEALTIRWRLGDKQQIAYSLHNLGVFALAQGEPERAEAYFHQDLALFREVGDKSGVVLSLQYQGLCAHLHGDHEKARSFLGQGLALARETGPRWVNSNYLLWLAVISAAEGRLERATRLSSAAHSNLTASASYWDSFERGYYERILAQALASLPDDVFGRAQSEGHALTLEQAIAYALENQEN